MEIKLIDKKLHAFKTKYVNKYRYAHLHTQCYVHKTCQKGLDLHVHFSRSPKSLGVHKVVNSKRFHAKSIFSQQ